MDPQGSAALEEQPKCPHCGRKLDETIPIALEGSILLKCPFCEMTYSFHRQEDNISGEEAAEYYLSPGPFRRRMVLGDSDERRETGSLARPYSCFFLCVFSPIILLGIYWLILNIMLIFS